MRLIRSWRPYLPVLLAASLAAFAALAGPAGASAGVTVSGHLREPGRRALPGMVLQARPVGATTCTPAAGCVITNTTAGGAFHLTGLVAGSYDLDIIDDTTPVMMRTLEVAPTATMIQGLALTLPAAAVPAGTIPRGAERALHWLEAERRRAGLPARILLNPRWSTQCAAHDAYELEHGTLGPTEQPAMSGYSAGGAWAGASADLAAGHWSAASSPWQDAPVSLLALLAPSLSVTGIDDSSVRQCAVTFPGMLRPPPAADTIHTVPGPDERGVPTSELARESPFTPVQFVGLSAARTTGRELFVYLNRTGMVGQAPVQITAATLRHDGRNAAVRWVDASTPRLGPDLDGAILIPVAPLLPDTTYDARVTVRDGTGSLTRTWSFTTA